jgi:hypothetical protein
MTLRDKTLKFMNLTMAPFDQTAENLVGQLRDRFLMAFGGTLPDEFAEATRLLETKLKERRPFIESEVARLVEQHFSEAELDVLLSNRDAEAEKKLGIVSPLIQNASAEAAQDWLRATMSMLEGDWRRLLGADDPAHADAPEAAPSAPIVMPEPSTPSPTIATDPPRAA